MDTEQIRRDLLEATLPNVVFDGWSERAIEHGARALDLDLGVALNAFPGGPAEMVAFFSEEADRRMVEAFEAADTESLRLRDKVALAVRLRLEENAWHREAISRAVSFLALPINAALATRLLYRTVDAIWHAVGDRSTDYNFYSKRLLLAGVYSATLLYWLNDRSENSVDTWRFLERRIDEVIAVGGRFGKAMRSALDLPDRIMGRRSSILRR
jgi:ubiquinone biosynthesis protein COQ9